MQTDKERAEKYVRSKCPELMELSFGCVIKENTGGQFATVIRIQDFVTKELPFDVQLLFEGETEIETVATEFLEEEMSIIGQPIQLQHWIEAIWKSKADLKQLTRKLEFDPRYKTVYHEVDNIAMTARSIKIQFDGNGQPATEADYHAFNQIVGI